MNQANSLNDAPDACGTPDLRPLAVMRNIGASAGIDVGATGATAKGP